jgi:hypothetical protein
MARRPNSHQLDKRAADIVLDDPAPPDEIENLYTTKQIAAKFSVTRQWLSDGRIYGYGPKYIRVGRCNIRYRHSDVVAWLDERVHASTAEYDTQGVGRPRKAK